MTDRFNEQANTDEEKFNHQPKNSDDYRFRHNKANTPNRLKDSEREDRKSRNGWSPANS